MGSRGSGVSLCWVTVMHLMAVQSHSNGEQKVQETRGVWGHAPPKNLEILWFGNAIYSLLKELLSFCIS